MPEAVAAHSKHAPGSRTFDGYRKKRIPWDQNPTRTLALALAG
ncbi:hypothetical protein ABZ192_29475 [Streptomyces sp. NPDC006235]